MQQPTRFGLSRATRNAAMAGLALAIACARTGPSPIPYGGADCQYCRMRITDPRFGAEVVTRTGKPLYFDSIECVAGFVAAIPGSDSGRTTVFVSDYASPGSLLALEDAAFLEDAKTATPMGRHVIATRADADTAAIHARVGGHWRTWAQVLASSRVSAEGERHASR